MSIPLDSPNSKIPLVDDIQSDSIWKKWFSSLHEYLKKHYLTFKSVSAATTIDQETVLLVDTSGGAVTVTLPPVAKNESRCYYIKDTDGGANAVTIDGNASETIDGSTTLVLATARGTAKLICTGTEWFRIGN